MQRQAVIMGSFRRSLLMASSPPPREGGWVSHPDRRKQRLFDELGHEEHDLASCQVGRQAQADLAFLRRVVALAARENGGQLTLPGPHDIGACHLRTVHHHDPGGDGRCFDQIIYHAGVADGCWACTQPETEGPDGTVP